MQLIADNVVLDLLTRKGRVCGDNIDLPAREFTRRKNSFSPSGASHFSYQSSVISYQS